jgi:hypothetical protein
MSIYHLWRLWAWMRRRNDLHIERFAGGRYYGKRYL